MTLKEMFNGCQQPRMIVELIIIGRNRSCINVRTIAEQNKFSKYQVMSWMYKTTENQYQVYVKEI